MAKASNVGIKIDTRKVPVIHEAKTFASMGLVPGGSYTNQRFCSKHLEVDSSVDPILLDIMSDPQTSGGLLISVPKDKAPSLVQKLTERNTPAASIIGEVVKEAPGTIQCY
jgi:selenide,water dikinase